MTSDKRAFLGLPLVALVLGACGGNYSNADLEFEYALPAKQDLTSKLPVSGTSRSGLETGQQQSAIQVGDTADFYTGTRDASNAFNSGLEVLLGIIEAARAQPPTSRTADSRTWGPFPLKDQPGFLAEVVIERSSPDAFTYRVQFRKNTTGSPWFTVLDGSFLASGGVRKGDGQLTLRLQVARDNGIGSADTSQLDTLTASYSTKAPPIRVDMQFTFVPEAALSQITYRYREQQDGQGAMRFVFTTPTQQFALTSRWLPDGSGIGEGTVTQGDFLGATQTECWDGSFILRYLSHSWSPFPDGNEAACPSVQPWVD